MSLVAVSSVNETDCTLAYPGRCLAPKGCDGVAAAVDATDDGESLRRLCLSGGVSGGIVVCCYLAQMTKTFRICCYPSRRLFWVDSVTGLCDQVKQVSS
jgi:hypothetical protein